MHTHSIDYFTTLVAAAVAKFSTDTQALTTITGPPIGVDLGPAYYSVVFTHALLTVECKVNDVIQFTQRLNIP